MIGRLHGKIEYRSDDHLLLDVHGVGYIIYCSERTLRSLPAIGEFTLLYTDLLVREDILQLFGFTSIVEKEWHRLLMTVQGVGAKAALAIMGALGEDGLSRAISIGDWAAVKQAKGIGPKTAQRVINELKEPLGAASVHEAIYCLIMMKNNFITGSANITEMDDDAKKFPIVAKTETGATLNTVMSNSFGFGGTNAALIFEKV